VPPRQGVPWPVIYELRRPAYTVRFDEESIEYLALTPLQRVYRSLVVIDCYTLYVSTLAIACYRNTYIYGRSLVSYFTAEPTRHELTNRTERLQNSVAATPSSAICEHLPHIVTPTTPSYGDHIFTVYGAVVWNA